MMQSPLIQQPEPFRRSARVDLDEWTVAQTNNDPDFTVNAPVELDGSWCTGLMCNTSGHVKLRLREMESTIILPILQGQMYYMNIAEIFPVGTTVEGIHIFGV